MEMRIVRVSEMKAIRSAAVVATVAVAVLSGWATGRMASHGFTGEAQAACSIENWSDSSGTGVTKYDTTDGVDEDNRWYGNSGNDVLWTQACNDGHVGGDADNDQLHGGAGIDTIVGGLGNDSAWGGAGDDVTTLQAGIDASQDVETPDGDQVWGDEGNDASLSVADTDTSDLVNGGSGTDSCFVDVASEKMNCE